MKYDVFISYRREGGDKYARTIQQALEKQYRVFLDFDELKDGVFDQRIIDAISESPVFLLILSKGALDRCVNEDDWVRQEILHAVKCGCHIVPVKIVDDNFEWLPDSLPEELSHAVGQHQFSELQMKTLFKASMEQLMKDRIAPHVRREDAETGIEITIDVDADCDLFRSRTFVRHLRAGEDNVIHLKPGKYKLEFVSTQFPEIKYSQVYSLASDIACDYIEVALKERVEKRQIEEESRRKAEEARRKAEEEARKQAEEFFQLGIDYSDGKNGKTRDDSEAAKWYREAAELGHADAQCHLGRMYENGLGVTQSYDEAVRWYRKAAEQGHAEAQRNLGRMYANGRGVTQSDEEAVKWYRKAAEQGHAEAQRNLGLMYENGRGVTQSDEEAVKWYRKAAERNSFFGGNADAQCHLGRMYANGRGVTKSDKEAVKWFRKAAENPFVFRGHSDAQFNLGLMYANGRGVTQSDDEAVKWFRKAAEPPWFWGKGHSNAQFELGVMYESGRGVTKNYDEAVKWYRKAAEQGNSNAKDALERLSEKS